MEVKLETPPMISVSVGLKILVYPGASQVYVRLLSKSEDRVKKKGFWCAFPFHVSRPLARLVQVEHVGELRVGSCLSLPAKSFNEGCYIAGAVVFVFAVVVVGKLASAVVRQTNKFIPYSVFRLVAHRSRGSATASRFISIFEGFPQTPTAWRTFFSACFPSLLPLPPPSPSLLRPLRVLTTGRTRLSSSVVLPHPTTKRLWGAPVLLLPLILCERAKLRPSRAPLPRDPLAFVYRNLD